MSSISVGELRRRGTVQTKIRGIIDALARNYASSIEITNPDFLPVSRAVENLVTIQEESVFSRRKVLTKPFTIPKEPDGEFLVFWDKSEGNPARPVDCSGYGNKTKLYGSAIPCVGIDTGGGGSYYCNYDGLTVRKITEDSAYVKLENKQGITFQFRIYPKDISDTSSDNSKKYRTLFAKADNENYGYCFYISDLGELVAYWNYNGQRYLVSTPTSTIYVLKDSEGRPKSFDIQITANFVDKYFSIMVNNAEYFDYTTEPLENLPFPNYNIDTNLHHGHLQGKTKNVDGTASHFFYRGGIQDLRIWRRKLTSQEMLNYYTNKLTINPCEFGYVGLTGEVIVAKSQLNKGIYPTGIYPTGIYLNS